MWRRASPTKRIDTRRGEGYTGSLGHPLIVFELIQKYGWIALLALAVLTYYYDKILTEVDVNQTKPNKGLGSVVPTF